MIPDTFKELQTQLQQLYEAEEYSAAVKLITQGFERYPERRPVLDYWRFTLSARAGDLDEALRAIEEAQMNGSWFSELIMRQSPSLKQLQGDKRFEALILRNQEIAEQDQRSVFPFYVLRPEGKCREGKNACPLLIGLHANGGTVQSSIEFWKPIAASGWLVAAVQSSQAWMKGAYIWDDREIAELEIQRDYESLIEHYRINPWQTVLAGHGMGGETAIWLALNKSIDVHLFLAICPHGLTIEAPAEWIELLRESPPVGMRGYILTGELDETIPQESIKNMVEIFNENGIRTELEIVPGVECDFSPEYEAAILRGLNFLTG